MVTTIIFLDPTLDEDGTICNLVLAFDYLRDVNGFYRELYSTYPASNQFSEYYEDEYMQRRDNDSIICNVFHLDYHRTNNNLEGWNRYFNFEQDKKKLNGVYAKIEHFQHENK